MGKILSKFIGKPQLAGKSVDDVAAMSKSGKLDPSKSGDAKGTKSSTGSSGGGVPV